MNTPKRTPVFSKRRIEEQKYASSRYDLLIIVIFSVVNMIALLTGGVYFLFSAHVPTILIAIGSAMVEEGAENSVMIVCIVVAAILILPYLLCWLFSKKRPGWMIAALVLFSLDTAVLLIDFLIYFDISLIFDIIIHGLAIWYLARGVKAGLALKNMPSEEEELAAEEAAAGDEAENEVPLVETVAIRPVKEYGKTKVLIEAEYNGHKISYQKYKKHEELVIDDMVYDETDRKSMQPNVFMRAVKDGVEITVVNANSKNYIMINGNVLKSNIRWL